jgi:hypothetical protein
LDFKKQRITSYDFLEKDQIQRTASPSYFSKIKEPIDLVIFQNSKNRRVSGKS